MPKVCAPLWTAAGPPAASSPSVVNGHVYVGGSDGLHVFGLAPYLASVAEPAPAASVPRRRNAGEAVWADEAHPYVRSHARIPRCRRFRVRKLVVKSLVVESIVVDDGGFEPLE